MWVMQYYTIAYVALCYYKTTRGRPVSKLSSFSVLLSPEVEKPFLGT